MSKLAHIVGAIALLLASSATALAEKKPRRQPKAPTAPAESMSVLAQESQSYDGGLARPLKIVRARPRDGVSFPQKSPSRRFIVPGVWQKYEVQGYTTDDNQYKLRALPRCTASTVDREEVRHMSLFSEMLDMLFIDPSDAWQRQSSTGAYSYPVPYVSGRAFAVDDPNFNIWSLFAGVA